MIGKNLRFVCVVLLISRSDQQRYDGSNANTLSVFRRNPNEPARSLGGSKLFFYVSLTASITKKS